MFRSHGVEMSAIERNQDIRIETLRRGYDGRIRSAQRKIRVLLDELGDADPLAAEGRLYIERFESAKKQRFDFGTLPAL